MGKLFQVKSQILLYDRVLGQKEHYLSKEETTHILSGYEELKKIAESSFLSKVSESLYILFIDLHPYEKGWLFFSILIPILLLKKVEGARDALWILPLIAGAYGVDNRLHGKTVIASAEVQLFPSESYLISTYLEEPFSQEIQKQREQLENAWSLYLIHEWAGEIPSKEHFHEQVKKGDFYFTLARIKSLSPIAAARREQQPLVLLEIYFLWNLLVALVCFTKTRASKQKHLQNIQ